MVYQHTLLIHLKAAVFHLADTDTAYKLIIVNGTDQYLGVRIRVAFRCGNVVYNGLKERSHIHLWIVNIKFCKTGSCRSIDKGAVQLFIGSIQIHHKLQRFVDHLFRTCFRTVDLIDAHDHGQI